jgi:hypothetical protein
VVVYQFFSNESVVVTIGPPKGVNLYMYIVKTSDNELHGKTALEK